MHTKRKRRLRVRILRSGWGFALMLALLLLSAWNTGNSLLYIVWGAVASLVTLSVVLSAWNLSRLRMKRTAPYAIHRTEPMMAGVRIENPRWFMPALSLRIEDTSAGKAAGYVLNVPARRAGNLNLPYVFERRGVQPLPPFDLVTTFPFGLFEYRRRCEDFLSVVVYPRVVVVRTSVLDRIAGGRTAASVPSDKGDEFFGLRDYIVGDDIRRIVWRISARMGKWMVREMSQETSRYVILALDARRGDGKDEFDAQFEEAVELTASLAISLLARQYDVSILTPAVNLEGGEGKHQERRALDFLARVMPVASEEYPGFDRRVAQVASGNVKLLYIAPEPSRWGGSSGVERHRVLDPREVLHA